jgi:hypothetical protein
MSQKIVIPESSRLFTCQAIILHHARVAADLTCDSLGAPHIWYIKKQKH